MCCYSCKYASTERCGDITIADYWGIERYHPDFYSHKGVSLVLVNSKKGKRFWQTAKEDFHTLKSELEYATKENHNLKHPTNLNAQVRSHIYEGIDTLSPEDYFELQLPVYPKMADYVKNILPVNLKLAFKKALFKLKRLE